MQWSGVPEVEMQDVDVSGSGDEVEKGYIEAAWKGNGGELLNAVK